MSRYYDPVTHRFVNADGYFQSGGDILDSNMSAYCANNPVMSYDPSGTCYVKRTTSAGTYIGTYWVVQTAIPGVPGFCNDCKSYGPNSENNLLAYSEHSKKGTTNQSNKNKHQKGQKRKQTDQKGGEKGDSRRPIDRSNKRHFEITEPTAYEYNDLICGVVIVAASIVVGYIIINDNTVIGVVDDVAIVPLMNIIWDAATKLA